MEPKKKEFPHKWKYHKTKKPLLVKSEEHEKFLGKEWTESPADHGVITHPMSEEQEAAESGFKPEEFESEGESELEVKAPEKGKKSNKKG